MTGRALLISLLLLMWGETAQAGQTLQQVLDNMVEAYGGAENLGKLDRMLQEWEMFAPMRNTHGMDLRYVQVPGCLRVELTYPDKKEVRVLNGDRAQVSFDDTTPRYARPPQADAMRLQLMRLYSPLALRNRIADLELTEDGGMLALSLEENGLQTDYLVNPERWHIEKVTGTLEINGVRMRFLTEYSEFDMVGGVLVHHRENKYAGNVNTARLQLREVTFDVRHDRRLFEVTATPGL
ncbi:MAG: hypothetical protein GWM87_04520 [Xanthomonadales bacterium]|nr:hypothetical protein [Xanthomonadales bacterium]NIX12273.1 hypothetical protein [Xanthomonadales bacterium]